MASPHPAAAPDLLRRVHGRSTRTSYTLSADNRHYVALAQPRRSRRNGHLRPTTRALPRTPERVHPRKGDLRNDQRRRGRRGPRGCQRRSTVFVTRQRHDLVGRRWFVARCGASVDRHVAWRRSAIGKAPVRPRGDRGPYGRRVRPPPPGRTHHDATCVREGCPRPSRCHGRECARAGGRSGRRGSPRAKTLPPIVGLLHCGYAGFDFPSPGQSVRFPVTQWAGMVWPVRSRFDSWESRRKHPATGPGRSTPTAPHPATTTRSPSPRRRPAHIRLHGSRHTVAAHGQRATCRIQSNAAEPRRRRLSRADDSGAARRPERHTGPFGDAVERAIVPPRGDIPGQTDQQRGLLHVRLLLSLGRDPSHPLGTPPS